MSSEINLRVKLISTYVDPSLEKEFVTSKAKELFGHEEPKSEKELGSLYDALFQHIVNEANEYLKTSGAQKLYKYAPMLDARSSYSSTIREKIDDGLEKIYHLSTRKLSSVETSPSQPVSKQVDSRIPQDQVDHVRLISCVALSLLLIGAKLFVRK
ncbi:MAG: hypothetical protein HYZ54_02275 [Ignavibacteriae bacterium]|nr:hypothetical protein [Ignavibacteriota bacterium]